MAFNSKICKESVTNAVKSNNRNIDCQMSVSHCLKKNREIDNSVFYNQNLWSLKSKISTIKRFNKIELEQKESDLKNNDENRNFYAIKYKI